MCLLFYNICYDSSSSSCCYSITSFGSSFCLSLSHAVDPMVQKHAQTCFVQRPAYCMDLFCLAKQNESSTSFSNLGRYFHTCIHTYIRMYVGVRACICTLPKLSFVIWQVHWYCMCIDILYMLALHWYTFMIEHAQSNTGFKQNRCWTNTEKRNKGNQWMDGEGGASSYRVTFKCKQHWYFFNLLGRQLTVRLKRT